MAKVMLSFCMLAGRLELYTVAVLLTPDFWSMARRPVWRWQRQKKNGNSAR
jgi:trk system potassium uptake protein TrkH